MSLLSQKRKRSPPELETLVPGDGALDHRSGSHWHGLQSLQNIVIFGDSYSKLDHGNTWVEHLRQRIRARSATAEEDLPAQLAAFFEKFPAKGRGDPTPALDNDIVFLGINDCGTTDSNELESVVEGVFDALHQLYVKAGARNFVLFDVPPVDRSPQAIESDATEEIANRVETWNELLRTQTAEFGLSSKEATVLLFSSHQVLTEVLEDPLEYDFSEDDVTNEGGGVWVDDLHLTSEVHDILGEQLFKSLLGL